MNATKDSRKAKAKAAPQAPTHVVHIEYFDPQAKRVYIAGTFNEWHPQATEMVDLGHGRWAKELTLPAGEHEYRLVVDGAWKDDPHCPLTAPNPYGTHNALLVLP